MNYNVIQAYADFVITVMGKICAPIRDEQIKVLANMTDVVSIFRGIMEVSKTQAGLQS